MRRRFALAFIASWSLAACGSDTAPVQLDEAGLVTATGQPVVSRYQLDDGYGLHFRPESLPGFSLEFRNGRVNVAWHEFTKGGDFTAANAENRATALRVLTRAFGQDTAVKIVQAAIDRKPLQMNVQGHAIRFSDAGPNFHLVSISR